MFAQNKRRDNRKEGLPWAIERRESPPFRERSKPSQVGRF
jgi:hypothetical protein